MNLSQEAVRSAELRLGHPAEVRMSAEMRHEAEWLRVVESARRGRTHDITIMVPRDGRLAVIRKPSYLPGVWRAPSGGVRPGERLEDGAEREAYEETGLVVEVERYLLRCEVTFDWEGRSQDWTTHVVEARWVSGEPSPIDTREIAAARWMPIPELLGPVRSAMLASGSGGLAYRARLQDVAAPLLRS